MPQRKQRQIQPAMSPSNESVFRTRSMAQHFFTKSMAQPCLIIHNHGWWLLIIDGPCWSWAITSISDKRNTNPSNDVFFERKHFLTRSMAQEHFLTKSMAQPCLIIHNHAWWLLIIDGPYWVQATTRMPHKKQTQAQTRTSCSKENIFRARSMAQHFSYEVDGLTVSDHS